MKFNFKALLCAALLIGLAAAGLQVTGRAKAAIQLGGSIWPLTYITVPEVNPTDGFNQMESLINQQAQANTYAVNPAANVAPQANPLVFGTYGSFLAASVNDPNASVLTGNATLLSGVAGRTIYPGSVTLEALGGNAAGATSIAVICYPSGTQIAQVSAIGRLLSGVPTSPFASYANINASLGTAFGSGCTVGDSVVVSAVGGGGLTGATSLLVNMLYFLQ